MEPGDKADIRVARTEADCPGWPGTNDPLVLSGFVRFLLSAVGELINKALAICTVKYLSHGSFMRSCTQQNDPHIRTARVVLSGSVPLH